MEKTNEFSKPDDAKHSLASYRIWRNLFNCGNFAKFTDASRIFPSISIQNAPSKVRRVLVPSVDPSVYLSVYVFAVQCAPV